MKTGEFWDSYDDGFNEARRNEGKKYQFKKDMKAKQEEANLYSAIGICACVLGWFHLAINIFYGGVK